MSIPMPTAPAEGIQLTVIPFREDAVIGTIALPTLVHLVPSPKIEEDPRALKSSSVMVRRHAEIRALVQRTLKASQKGRNVPAYARYIASGVQGEFGSAWSTPPITLWLDDDPIVGDELVPGSGVVRITLIAGAPVVAIDGETQVTAWHTLYESPGEYGLTHKELNRVRLPFELYWGISVQDARQIFHDRNVEGVAVDKNLAMSMDQRDLGTQLAHRVAEAVKVERDGKLVTLSKLVQSRKRQLAKSDPEVITLSGLRVLVITTIFGRAGLELSSSSLHAADLPDGVTSTQVERRVVPLLTNLLTRLYPQLAARSAVSAPAVLAGLGIAAHHTTEWCTSGPRLSDDDLWDLLADIRWEREARYWDGIAAKAGARGLNFGGGAKDSGGRVAEAILYPGTVTGRQIRGL